MKAKLKTGLIIAFLATSIAGHSQEKQGNICYVNNDRMFIQLDDRWSATRKKEVSGLYNIDSLLMEQAFNGKIHTTDSLIWTLSRLSDHIVELSKSLSGQQAANLSKDDVVLLDDSFFVPGAVIDSLGKQWRMTVFPQVFDPWFSQPRPYGLNDFGKHETVKIKGDTVTFLLPGYQDNRSVYLAGSFNNWSTTQLPMKKTGSGWQAELRLSPGRYLYKFIVDGRWIHDPYNKQKERDGQGGFNSVFYCYNYVFRLNGYLNARNVVLAGSFNDWQPNRLKMKKTETGWELPVYLEEGTHAYKFVVDGQWITDPANKVYRADANGNVNSFMGIGDTVVFRLAGFDSARQVVLSGSFNRWSPDELVMNKVQGGWELPYVLGRGYYEYKFIVDGRWMPDPANPSTTGSGDYTNSCLIVGANYTFRLAGFSDAQKVIVTGSFNGWQTESYRMNKTLDGWEFPVYLKPGKYTYKFIVDGTWLLDPANELWEPNAEGTGNSVLWIEP